MKNCILFIGVLVLISNSGFSQKEENHMINDSTLMSTYMNYGINIFFKGSIDIIKNNYDEDKNQDKGYFYKSFEIIRFNENKITIAPNSQHIISEEIHPDHLFPDTNRIAIDDSLEVEKNDEFSSVNDDTSKPPYSSLFNSFSYHHYLSSLYIMPKMSMKKLKEEIELYVGRHSLFQIVHKIQEIIIGDKTVLKWRAQNGKTRLDHYVVFGKDYNYLFVSSPYGTNGVIENVILEMELLK